MTSPLDILNQNQKEAIPFLIQLPVPKESTSFPTSWRPPQSIRTQSYFEKLQILKKHNITLQGPQQPLPIKNFSQMRLPQQILEYLESKNINKPTAIQMVGIPTLLSGQDCIGISQTGSGKTLTFLLPLILRAIESENQTSYVKGDGPFGLLMVPSRELAQQSYEQIEEINAFLHQKKFPKLNVVLCMGGMNSNYQQDKLRKGVHIIVATPGRLADWINRKLISLQELHMVVLDEGERLLEQAFEQALQTIFNDANQMRQTCLFSSSLAQQVLSFTQKGLKDPIVILVGRSGAANTDVVQEVEYVKQELKMPMLLESMKKTPPPLIIFCENKDSVDDIQEYLLLKGVVCASLHSGKTQSERYDAIHEFKSKKKDVLIATDVVGKGLDFEVNHVINFDMPKDIESYVHRIGRTGRGGKQGYSTTFINRSSEIGILLDLKYLLKEAKQNIPTFLKMLKSDVQTECVFCGGMGHQQMQCPKIESQRQKASQLKSQNLRNSVCEM